MAPRRNPRLLLLAAGVGLGAAMWGLWPHGAARFPLPQDGPRRSVALRSPASSGEAPASRRPTAEEGRRLVEALWNEGVPAGRFRAALGDWARLDPRGALAFAKARLPAELAALFAQCFVENPSAAITWATGPQGEPALAITAIARTARSDPGYARELAAMIPVSAGAARRDTYHLLIDAGTESGRFAEQAGWVIAIGEPVLRLDLASHLVRTWALSAPPDAAGWLARQPDSLLRQALYADLFSAWADSSPAEAAAYAGRLADGAVRRQALGDIANRWLARDPAGASAWLDSLEYSPDLDRAAFAVATHSPITPDTAVSWAESIADPGMRRDALDEIVRTWARTDPAAARAYLGSMHSLPEPERAEIARSLPGAAPGP